MNFKMEPSPRISANAFVLEQEENFPSEALQQFTALLDPDASYIGMQVEANNSVALYFIDTRLLDKLTAEEEACLLERFRIQLVKVLNDANLETPDQMYDFAGIKTYLFRPGDSAKLRLFKWAMTVAQIYFEKANPDKWDGKHEKPANVDSRICTFSVNEETELDLSLDFSKEENLWYILCELRDKETEDGFDFSHSTANINDCTVLAKVICNLITLFSITVDFTALETAQTTDWVKTDDAQYVRLIKPGEYELTGVIELPEDFAVCHGHVHLNDYTEEEQHMILSSYGYGDFRDMVNRYGEAYAGQLFAECAFEYEFTEFIEENGNGHYKTFEAAMARVKEIIGETEESTK